MKPLDSSGGIVRVSSGTALLLLIWFALVAGLGEAGGLAIRKFVNGNPIRTTPHAVWMAPLADVLFFGVPLLFLLLLARLFPKLRQEMRARPAET